MGLAFPFSLEELCFDRGIAIDEQRLPAGVRRLTALASGSPRRTDTSRSGASPSFFARLGEAALREAQALRQSVTFLGESMIAFAQLLRGQARYRRSDLFLLIQERGAQELPIVTVIALLIGVVLAFVGAIQLRTVGFGKDPVEMQVHTLDPSGKPGHDRFTSPVSGTNRVPPVFYRQG